MGLNNDANLELLLKLDEASGATTFVDSAKGNNGTGMSTPLTTGVAGVFGNCITCTASTTNHGITLNNEIDLAADFTISVHVRAGVNNDPSGICGSSVTDVTYWQFFTGGGSTTGTLVADTTEVFTLGSAFPTGAWVHLVMVRSSGTITLYLNGIAETDTETNSSHVYVQYVATRFAGRAESWNGQFDDFRIYSRALNLTEINTLRDNPYTNAGISPGVSSNITLPIAYSPDRSQY